MWNSVSKEEILDDGTGAHHLSLYISSECFSCQESILMMADVERSFPQLRTEIVNLDDAQAEKPDSVFAVPTYVLDGQILSLGNPHREVFISLIRNALSSSISRK